MGAVMVRRFSLLSCVEIAVLAIALAMAAGAVKPAEQVLPLSVVEDEAGDPGRVFLLPVTCNSVEARFELGCFGDTRISENFAKQCDARVYPDAELDNTLDPDGKPIYAGTAMVRIVLAGQEQEVRAQVMKDECCQKPEKEGMLGFDVLRNWQWEVDPTVPELTLRAPGAPPVRKPLAILPLKVTPLGYYLRVRIRNVSEDVSLMPASSFVQAGPALQRKWDLSSGKEIKLDVKRFGAVRTVWLHGDDVVELTPMLRETDLLVALMDDPKKPHFKNMEENGLGQCVLNRYIYCVEPRRQQLRIMARVPQQKPTSVPATAPASSK
jgi:hypothetical protein